MTQRTWDEWRDLKASREAVLPLCDNCGKMIFPQDNPITKVVRSISKKSAGARERHEDVTLHFHHGNCYEAARASGEFGYLS